MNTCIDSINSVKYQGKTTQYFCFSIDKWHTDKHNENSAQELRNKLIDKHTSQELSCCKKHQDSRRKERITKLTSSNDEAILEVITLCHCIVDRNVPTLRIANIVARKPLVSHMSPVHNTGVDDDASLVTGKVHDDITPCVVIVPLKLIMQISIGIVFENIKSRTVHQP